jgi:hypothetical protein
VLDQHDLVVFLSEGLPQVLAGIFVQSSEQFGVHSGYAGRRFEQAFAIRVFANRGQDLAHGAANSFLVYVAGTG